MNEARSKCLFLIALVVLAGWQSLSHGKSTGPIETISTEYQPIKNGTNHPTPPSNDTQMTNETDNQFKTTTVFSSHHFMKNHSSDQAEMNLSTQQISSTQMIDHLQETTSQTTDSPTNKSSNDFLTTQSHPKDNHESSTNQRSFITSESNMNINSTTDQKSIINQSSTKQSEPITISIDAFSSLMMSNTSDNSGNVMTTTASIISTTKAANITTTTTTATATTSTTKTTFTTTVKPILPPQNNDSNSQPPPNELCKNVSQCPDNSWCQVIKGSSTCNCKSGYTKFASICLDIDECIIGSHNCNPQTSICTNTNGGFSCTCLPGYGGVDCTDVNECDSIKPPVCDTKGFCINTIGSYRCYCPSNYQLAKDDKTCIDIDECMQKTSGCSERCINLEGGFTCSCQAGLKLEDDSKTCIATTPCQSSVNCRYKCSQITGVDTCLCPIGFQMSSGSCVDIDECNENNPCDSVRGVCTNTNGSFACSCRDGYTIGPNYSCADRDGGWSDWGVWSSCDKSCQGGLKIRRRTCSNPSSERFGLSCQGNDSESMICNSQDCPLTEEEAKYGIPIYIKGLELSKFLQVNPVMLEILATALNNYCLANQKNLRSCCGKPTDIIPQENDTRTLIKWQNILSGNGFPRKISELLIKTLLIVKFPKDNELCTGPGSKARRKRAVSSTDPAVSQQVADASMTDSVFYNAQNSLMQSVLSAFNQTKDITVYKDDQKSGTAIPWWAILLIILAIILLIIIIIIIIICCCKCCKKKKRVNPEDHESRPVKKSKQDREMAILQKKKDEEREKEEKRRQKEHEKQEKEKAKREKELEKQKERENKNRVNKRKEDDKYKSPNQSPKSDKFRGHPSEPRDQTSAHRNRRPIGVGHMQHADADNAKTRLHSATSRKGSRGTGSLNSMFPDIDDDSPAMSSMPGNKFVIPSKVKPISVKPPN